MIRQLIASVALLAVLACDTRVSAQAVPSELAVRARVEVTAAGSGAVLDAMAQRIEALQKRMAIVVTWSVRPALDVRDIVAPRVDTAQRSLARVWLDLSAQDRALIFIANSDHDRFLVRVLPVDSGYGELTQEALTTIVESAVDALLAGGQIGLERSAAVREIETHTGERLGERQAARVHIASPAPSAITPPTGEPAARAQPPAHLTSLALHYRGDAIDAGPALRHGAQLSITRSNRSQNGGFILGASTLYFPRHALGDGPSGVDEHTVGVRALVGVSAPISRRIDWNAALHAGVDVTHVRPRIAPSENLVARSAFVILVPILGLSASAAWQLTSWLQLSVGIGCDMDLSGRHFDVTRVDATRGGEVSSAAVVTPWRLHPYALAGVIIPLSVSP